MGGGIDTQMPSILTVTLRPLLPVNDMCTRYPAGTGLVLNTYVPVT